MSEIKEQLVKTMEYCKMLRVVGEEAIKAAIKEKERGKLKDAVNWADLGVTSVEYCLGDDGEESYRITIDEASPEAYKFSQYIQRYVVEKTGNHKVFVYTEW
jgi:hypothetical protein